VKRVSSDIREIEGEKRLRAICLFVGAKCLKRSDVRLRIELELKKNGNSMAARCGSESGSSGRLHFVAEIYKMYSAASS